MRIFRLVSTIRRQLPRILPLMRDPRVPLWAKVAAGFAAALVISPLDLFGDIPVLGLVDDAALLMFVAHLFVSFADRLTAPQPVVVRSAGSTNLAKRWRTTTGV